MASDYEEVDPDDADVVPEVGQGLVLADVTTADRFLWSASYGASDLYACQ